MSGSFVTYLGWLHPWGTPLTPDRRGLTTKSPTHDGNSSRIGVDDIAGAADVEAVGDAADERRYRVADFAALAEALGTDGLTILDVRQSDEFDESHIAGAVNIPLHELLDRVDELPDRRRLGALRIRLPRVYCGVDSRQVAGAMSCSSTTSSARLRN